MKQEKRFHGWWVVAAVLVLAAGFAALWLTGQPGGPGARLPIPGTVQTLAAANPKQAPYADYFKDKKGHEAWAQQNAERQAALADYRGELNSFFGEVMTQFLSEKDGENKVISPLNLYMALAMLAEATDGESRGQILDLLGAENVETLGVQADRVWRGTYRNDGNAAAVLANSLWLREDTNYVPSTVDRLAETYHASSFRGTMGAEGMDRALRDWLDRQTDGLLKEQAQGLSLDPTTVLALVSTVCFRDRWETRFLKEHTAPGVFHAAGGDVERDFLHQTIYNGAVFWGERFTAVRKGFRDGEGWMWLILPDEGVAPEELPGDEEVAELLSGAWNGMGAYHVDTRVVLSVPKFDISADVELSAGLKALGVTDVFEDIRADFSPVTGEFLGAYVSRVDQAARVLVDEEGCAAASYAAVEVVASAGPGGSKEVEFTLDRPFLFAVQNRANLTLFAGVVNEP